MPFKNLKIEIIPESDSIQLFHDQETLRGEEYSLHGRLRLIPLIEKQTQRKKNNAPPPVSVQHIHLRLQGYIQTVLTNNIPDDEQDNTKKCKDITTLTLLDRIMYSAKGYANVTECILDQHMTVSPNLTSLTAPTDVPFTFLIEQTHLLPPSMHSSTHLISYTMTAMIQEDTMLKKCEICQQQQHLLHHPYSKNCHDVFMNILKKKRRKSKTISGFNTIPLSVKCYSYASLYNLHYQPRIKYCGARPSCLQYEIHLAKYLLYDNYDLPFQCHFKPLSPSVHINRLYFYILQTEKYPYVLLEIS
ncbi:hypothetical protein BJ944DRAFT_234587 [Cunninghamella echinulata]|nr:hypothetical protein BJ944DRAFT_234587 [Cunninghamella echinulata]